MLNYIAMDRIKRERKILVREFLLFRRVGNVFFWTNSNRKVLIPID